MNIVEQIRDTRDISREQLELILGTEDKESIETLRRTAREVATAAYGNKIFMRGLIELSSHCKNDCLYCGLRRSNKSAVRYRLTDEQILECCDKGYALGFRTFVMQGGEDGWFDDKRMCRIVGAVRKKYPDCAITLSLARAIKPCSMPVPTAICCATRRLRPSIMPSCILLRCRGRTA